MHPWCQGQYRNRTVRCSYSIPALGKFAHARPLGILSIHDSLNKLFCYLDIFCGGFLGYGHESWQQPIFWYFSRIVYFVENLGYYIKILFLNEFENIPWYVIGSNSVIGFQCRQWTYNFPFCDWRPCCILSSTPQIASSFIISSSV